MKRILTFFAIAAVLTMVSCKQDNPENKGKEENKEEQGGGDQGGDAGGEEDQFVDVFGTQITAITDVKKWEGAVFDAIMDNSALAGEADEKGNYTVASQFVNENLGYYPGTEGKFVFKKNEQAYADKTKLSRVQLSGGKLCTKNNLVFRAGGKGELTLIARSSGDDARYLLVALNGDLLSEEGIEAPGKASDAKTIKQQINAASGDLITIMSKSGGINLYSVKWIPEGKTDDTPGGDTPGGDTPGGDTPGGDTPATDITIAYDDAIAEKVTEGTVWDNEYFKEIVNGKPDYEATADAVSFGYKKLGFLAGEGDVDGNHVKGKFKFSSDRVQFGGTGILAQLNNIAFRVAGPGTLVVKAVSGNNTDATRKLFVAVGENVVNAEGSALDASTVNEFSYPLTTAEGDIVYIYASKPANVYSIKWVPEGGVDPDIPKELPEGWTFLANNNANAKYQIKGNNLSITSNGKFESGKQTFGLVYKEISGDFTATVKLVSFDPTKESNQACAGLFIADGDPSALEKNLVFAQGGYKYANYRVEAGQNKVGSTVKAPAASGGDAIVKMVREGNNVQLSYSLDGGTTFSEPVGVVFEKKIDENHTESTLGETVKIGLAASSGDNTKTSTAVFTDLTINGEKEQF